MKDLFDEKEKQQALVIVAHPDDETVWMGGTILKHKDWTWKIISATQWRDGIDRFLDLKKAAGEYQKYGVPNIDVDTVGLIDTQDEEQIKKLDQENKLHDYFSKKHDELKDFTTIFTHNKEGEYGHAQHKMVNRVVSGYYKNVDVWQFICPDCRNIAPQPMLNETIVIPLDRDILDKKMQVFNSSYLTELYLWRDFSDFMVYEFKTGPEIFTK